jgi:hypothetical protein
MSKYYHTENPDEWLTLVKKGDDQNTYKDDTRDFKIEVEEEGCLACIADPEANYKYKTVFCLAYLQGCHCKFADAPGATTADCAFAHGASELRGKARRDMAALAMRSLTAQPRFPGRVQRVDVDMNGRAREIVIMAKRVENSAGRASHFDIAEHDWPALR